MKPNERYIRFNNFIPVREAPDVRESARLSRETREHYLRDNKGHLLSKPEAGLVAAYALAGGIGRCSECGGSLWATSKGRGADRLRYYCRERTYRGTCENGHGVPVADLDGAVRSALYDKLVKDREAVWALVVECRDRRARERQQQSDVRPSLEREAAKLEVVVTRLTDAVEAGQPVGDRLKQRTAELEALRLKLAEPEPVTISRGDFDRQLDQHAEWLAPKKDFKSTVENPRFQAARVLNGDPRRTRQVLRKLAVERVLVHPDGSFDGDLDLAGVLQGASGGGRRGPLRST